MNRVLEKPQRTEISAGFLHKNVKWTLTQAESPFEGHFAFSV